MSVEFKRNDGKTDTFTGMNIDELVAANKSVKSNKKFYEDWIDNLDFDMGKFTATMRNALKTMIEATVTVGKVILRIGKIVLDILMKVVKKLVLEFPNAIMGMAFGFFFGLICSAIPFLGWALGPALTPLFMLGGGLTGFFTDFRNKLAASGMESSFRNTIREEMGNLGSAI